MGWFGLGHTRQVTVGPLGGRDDPVTHGGGGGARDRGAGAARGRPGGGRGGREAATLRVADVVVAGHRGDAATARRALASPDPRVREVALGALARSASLDPCTVETAIRSDPDPGVRRRACDVAATFGPDEPLERALREALDDPDPLVVEAACWALGESCAEAPPPEPGARRVRTGRDARPGASALGDVLDGLASTVRSHPDARAREAAVAALGAIGDPRGVGAVLDALGDRPTVRRRAVVALAAFDGEEVAVALRASARDRDWQVREVAEILLGD